MSYTPFNWQARTGQGLNKFTDQITGQVFELQSTPDSIDNEGTPFSPTRMNALEQGLGNVYDKDEQLQATTAQNVYGLPSTSTPDDVFQEIPNIIRKYRESTFQKLMTGRLI